MKKNLIEREEKEPELKVTLEGKAPNFSTIRVNGRTYLPAD